MATGGFREQKPALDNQLENILQTFKTFLDRFLFFKGGHVVGAMLNAGQQTSESSVYHIKTNSKVPR